MEKIGVIADPHANLDALKAVLKDMENMDRIICAGDLVGYGPEPNEVIELLKSRDVLSVRGNIDHAVVNEKFDSLDEETTKATKWTYETLKNKNLNYLKKLNKTTEIQEEGYEIFMAHGTPRNPLDEYLYPGTSNRALVRMTREVDTDFIVLGHTHVPLEQMIQGKHILNPGAVGQPRDRNPDASYMILKLGEDIEIIHERVSYDIEKTEKKIDYVGLPEKFAIRLHFGW